MNFRQNELKRLIITNNETLDLENYTAHDCASVLKTIIQEMDEPVVSLNYFFAFQQVAGKILSKRCGFFTKQKIYSTYTRRSLQLEIGL